MAHGHSLVIQNLVVDDVALGTLDARAAIVLNSSLGATLNATFLVQRVKMMLRISDVQNPDEGPFIACLNNGNNTTGETAAAFTDRNTVGPTDTTQMLTQDAVYQAWQQSVKMFRYSGNSGIAAHHYELFADFRLNKGKGVPAQEESGVSLSLINLANNALGTGANVHGLVQLYGRWMRD